MNRNKTSWHAVCDLLVAMVFVAMCWLHVLAYDKALFLSVELKLQLNFGSAIYFMLKFKWASILLNLVENNVHAFASLFMMRCDAIDSIVIIKWLCK